MDQLNPNVYCHNDLCHPVPFYLVQLVVNDEPYTYKNKQYNNTECLHEKNCVWAPHAKKWNVFVSYKIQEGFLKPRILTYLILIPKSFYR